MYVLSRKQQNMMKEIKKVKQEWNMDQKLILRAKLNEMKAKNDLIQRKKDILKEENDKLKTKEQDWKTKENEWKTKENELKSKLQESKTRVGHGPKGDIEGQTQRDESEKRPDSKGKGYIEGGK
ncbi:hypothetical protein TNIN_97881 [Trichonephila inaurata madagascariensis]|uniref:Uncharacterized protein n=1 Tax=Trichonephila inaurata madagascariensis TaxID=2747483 RepID=A0A8X7C6V7_9ARAC|nr:hypothetical protein TNIN_97881 [Trichonephila inaurata madagascariensis]